MNSVESKLINIKVKTLDNALHEFTITKDSSIDDLKNKIASQINIPVNRQRIIFQGKMLKNHETISTYKIEDGHVLHLVANPGIVQDTERDNNSNTHTQSQQQAGNIPREGESSPLAESLADLELISGLIRTLSETTFNRRNLRRRILQQRTNGFNMDVNESLETIRQNTANIDTMINSLTKPSEILHDTNYVNPFNFSRRKLHIGQWVDVKDTIDQWLEAQVINIRDNQAYVHYNGWGTRWDEWIDMNSSRIALFRTHTVQSSNTRYMGPFPNNAPDGDATNIPQYHVDFPDLLGDVKGMMDTVSNTTNKLLQRLNPAQSTGKSEKSDKHSRHDIELQNVISGMIEEQKSNPHERENRSEKYVQFEDTQSVKSHKSMEKNVMFEDAQSVKSHKSLDYDAISLKSIKSFVSTSDMKNVNPPLNFPEYISEEDSEEISEIQSNVHISHPNHLRELQISLFASQLAPLYDRLGRLMIDLAPHLAMLGSTTQSMNPVPNGPTNPVPNNPNLTFASILTNESGQTAAPTNAPNRQFAFQMPVMLTPGEVIAANNNTSTSNRILNNENNNVEFHIHAILGPFRNAVNNPSTNINPGPTTSNPSGSPLRYSSHDTRSNRSETSERRDPNRRISGVTFTEPLERRRTVQPPQHSTFSHPILSREHDRTSLEREDIIRHKPSKEREDENLNEISFGTRRDVETETDNIFADSDTTSQGRNPNMEIELELNNRNGGGLTRQRSAHEEDDNIFRTPRQSISSDRNEGILGFERNLDSKQESKKEIKEESQEDDKNYDHNDNNNEDEEENDEDNDHWNNTSNRRSNCGRNVS